MRIYSKLANRLLIVNIIAGSLTACGGGGEPGDLNNANTLNANAFGYIYYADNGNQVTLRHEIVTGLVTQHVYNDFKIVASATASDDSSLFSVMNKANTAADIYDAGSNHIARLVAGDGERFTPPVEFSPNNQYFMVYRYGTYDSNSNEGQLELYNFNGLISYLPYIISGYDWLNDSEVIYISGDSIYRQKFNELNTDAGAPELVYQFTGEAIWGLNVSPDGQKVAVIKEDDSVHVVDILGYSEKLVGKVLTDPTDEIDGLNAVRWSPDGKYLAVATRALEISYIAQGCSFIAVFPSDPTTEIDIGDQDNLLFEYRNDEEYITCVGDLFSFSWRAQ